MGRQRESLRRKRMRLATLVACLWVLACGIEARDYSPEVPPQARGQAGGGAPGELRGDAYDEPAPFEWPSEPDQVAVLSIRDHGEIRLGLYSEVAPRTVENFAKLAQEGFYDGTTFHRVVPGFMIQGGDPNSKDDDPDNDGRGGPGYRIADEFSRAPHERGVVAMANKGAQDTGGSQFFVVHKDSPFLTGKYSAFARVIDGMDVVDSVAKVETDRHGRWGSKDRPLEAVVVESVRIEGSGDGIASR